MLRRLIELIANRTRQNPIQAGEIETLMNMDTGHTNEPTRFFIKDAIIDNELPIGSNNQGYFLINSDDDLEAATKSLASRIEALESRIDALQEGWRRRQQSLENGWNWPITEN
jgi:hypothetical protein